MKGGWASSAGSNGAPNPPTLLAVQPLMTQPSTPVPVSIHPVQQQQPAAAAPAVVCSAQPKQDTSTLDNNPLDRILTSSEEGRIDAFLPLAAAIGPSAGDYMADTIGRKKTLLIGATSFILAYILNIIATNVY
ncbi:unnamed protein product [Phaedon cochleariae]|uniref:Uncharacterized protein n=1 Tax=Phaedon cochleariae TaxID=80249 RepID=A0A9N9X1L2_PHACE|nr:unnamed protein product [Phaedon cochleariae]